MIKISQDALICRLAEEFNEKKPETVYQVLGGLLGLAFSKMCFYAFILIILYFVSIVPVELIMLGRIERLSADQFYLLPYQGAFWAFAAVLYKAAAWLCERVEIVKED